HAFGDAAFVIQWHVVAMFAPAFITGHLIHRFGATTVILLGGVMFLACAAIAMSGLDLFNFWAALVLLGFGWAFMFVGATTLVTEVHTAPERAKTQALNDLIVFGAVAIASFLSAPVLAGFGWTAVILISVPPVLLAMGATLFLHFRRPALAA
ncbi:MAG: MFS transporter, partial [Alphaproteobacteria bacterium]|nr:MFS transporter [Alphaproteobacteria bacterium]